MTLEEFFAQHRRVAVAFSGGVDSAYLLGEALAHGAACTAYFVRTPFQPAFELRDAEETAAILGAELRVLPLDVLADPQVAANPADRCYHCKRRIFAAIAAAAGAEGYDTLLDGTNASDDAGDRPGMRALAELAVLSPLRLCGVTKDQVRQGARAMGLPVWDKPSYACLATRIPTGTPIAAADLERVERGENILMDMGFRDFRLRLRAGGLLQLRQEDMAAAQARWPELQRRLGADFPHLTIDHIPRPGREN